MSINPSFFEQQGVKTKAIPMKFFHVKGLVLALLLAIFSAQGLGLAAGINIVHASRALAHLENPTHQEETTHLVSTKMGLDLDDMKILSIAEELSDYIAFEFIFPAAEYFAPSVPIATWMPISVILPNPLPPPRS